MISWGFQIGRRKKPYNGQKL